MPSPLWRLTVKLGFSAAHQLRNYGGKCERMHGHNFGVEVVVEGSRLDPKVEYLVDFKVLKNLTREILEELDHHHLNEHPFFLERNPSSENIAMYVYRQLSGKLPENVRLVEVSVAEKEAQKATYMEV
ncbi:MAG: 6-carboxytetrahydropterin synthase QueD [Desulfovibrio sp.]|jgi:6-pyruvoyltetrahydropterin/6-carboxytetrahydropterin synthase|nr:6-carboxytetrahydropterin synthase QueD [Desulfovibrio sp.]